MDEKTVNLQLLGAGSQTYSIETSGAHLENIEKGYILFGEIQKEQDWKLSKVIRVFPPQAAQSISSYLQSPAYK